MNIDNGHIKYWNELTEAEKESGRWMKLTDSEYSAAITIEEHERRGRMNEIFAEHGKPEPFDNARFDRAMHNEHRHESGFDALGRPRNAR